VFLRDQNADLRDTFLNNGYQSIPVVVFFEGLERDRPLAGARPRRHHFSATMIRSKTMDNVPKEQQDAAMAEFRSRCRPTSRNACGASQQRCCSSSGWPSSAALTIG
jgi:hypothetical protein